VDADRADTEHVLTAGRQTGHLVGLDLRRQLLDGQPRVLADVSTLDEVARHAGDLFSGRGSRCLPLEGDRAATHPAVRQLGRCSRRLCIRRNSLFIYYLLLLTHCVPIDTK